MNIPSTVNAPLAEIAFAPAAVIKDSRPDGTVILRSPESLQPYERHLGEMLRSWAARDG